MPFAPQSPDGSMSAMSALFSSGTDGITGMFQFGFGSSFGQDQAQSTAELNTGIEMSRDNQLIVDIAIAELQMDSDFGMICGDGAIHNAQFTMHNEQCAIYNSYPEGHKQFTIYNERG